ncbi:MAG: sugar ABC transporter substrate-binding protein [Actinomycetales bacterium]
MRRTLRSVGALSGLLLLVTGCSSSGSGDTTTDSSSAPAPASSSASSAPASSAAASGTLTIWADDTRAKPITDIAQKFEQDKGVTVKVVQKDFGKIRDDLISQGPSGEGPDVVIGANDWTGKLVTNGAITPIELGDKASQFEKVALDGFTYDGKLYGLPYSTENIALIRNTTLAPTSPKTFDEMVAMGQKLVKEGKATLPLAIQQDPKNGDPYHLYPVETSFGSFVFGKDAQGNEDPNKLTLDDAAGIKFAQALSKWGQEKVLSTSVSGDIAKKAFLDGKTPFIVTGPWNTPDFTKAGIKFNVENVPSAGGEPSRPFVGVQGFFISNYSKNKLLANDFVTNYIATPEVAKALFDAGGRPPAMTSVLDQVKSDPVLAGFAQVAANGVPLPKIPAMDSVWGEWGPAEAAIIQGKGGDPATVWKQMADRIRAKIKG